MQCNLYVYFELKYLNVIVHYKKKRNTKEINLQFYIHNIQNV